MSLYDRGYYQEPGYTGGAPQRPKTAVAILITINVVVFFLDQFTPAMPGGGHWLSDHLALKADLFQKPWQAWQLLTAGFAHAPLDGPRFIWHIFGNMVGLFIFGRALESLFGKQEFVRLYLTLLVLSLLVWVGIESLATGGQSPRRVLGASGAIAGLVVIFALRFPHQKMMLIPFPAAIPAWAIGLLLVGSDLFGALRPEQPGEVGGGVAFTAHLAGAALGAVYHFTGIHLGNLFPFTLWSQVSKRGPRLKVHRPRPNKDAQLAERADKILQKLHEQGEASITRKERKILNEYSRKVREGAGGD